MPNETPPAVFILCLLLAGTFVNIHHIHVCFYCIFKPQLGPRLVLLFFHKLGIQYLSGQVFMIHLFQVAKPL